MGLYLILVTRISVDSVPNRFPCSVAWSRLWQPRFIGMFSNHSISPHSFPESQDYLPVIRVKILKSPASTRPNTKPTAVESAITVMVILRASGNVGQVTL